MEHNSRPIELGTAYFYFDGKLIDIAPHRNHKDWLLDNIKMVRLSNYVIEKPSKALFESYKLGWVRLVWDENGTWQHGKMTGQGSTLYINGIDRNVWRSMRGTMNNSPWVGRIDNVVIEYLDIVNDKPKWDRADIYSMATLGVENFDNLYKGRKPRRSLAPVDAVVPHYAQESFEANRCRNLENDL